METTYISEKIRQQRERHFTAWAKWTDTFTTYVHAYQTPMGRVETVERFDKKRCWVALTLNASNPTDSAGRYHAEVFEYQGEALRACEQYFDRQRARTGWNLTAAYVVPTVVVRKRKTTSTPVEYELATPRKVED